MGDEKIYLDEKQDALYPTLDISDRFNQNMTSISVMVTIELYPKLEKTQLREM